MLLAIDAGNTRIKTAVFEHGTTVAQFTFGTSGLSGFIQNIFSDFPGITHIAVASVSNIPEPILKALSDKASLKLFSHLDTFPFSNLYTTPETLGVDRMVLAAGAVLSFPAMNRLVIDAGTCITYDFVNDADQYLGGAISPGIGIRYKALNDYTAKLPLLQLHAPDDITGNSTAQSMHSGVVNGTVSEIDGFIDRYRDRYSNFTIILTGGDAEFLAKRLKNTIFANSNFLLESLNHTFQYTLQK